MSDWSPEAQKLARYRETSEATQQGSAAVVTTLLNSILSARSPRLLTSNEVMRTDPTGQWLAATDLSAGRGLDIEMLGLVALRAFWASGLRQVSVDASPCSAASFSEMLASFRFVLTQGAQHPAQVFIIIHSVDARGVAQDAIAAQFDIKRDRVLLLTSDRTDPFWAWHPVQALLQQMRTPSCVAARGCGYVTVRLGR